jgi:uncharacterized membrane protein
VGVIVKLKGEFKNRVYNELDNPIFLIIIGYLSIILLASPRLEFNPIYSILVITMYVMFFAIGFYSMKRLEGIIKKKHVLTLLNVCIFMLVVYGVYITEKSFIGIIYAGLLIAIIYNAKYYCHKFHKKFMDALFILGTVSFIILLAKYSFKIPVFDYNVRMSMVSDPLRLISTGCLIFASFKNKYYFIISFIVLFLIGYKLSIFILIMAYVIYKYRKKELNAPATILSIVSLFLLMGIMFKIILSSSNQSWDLNIIEMIIFRANFDFSIFNKIIHCTHHTFGGITFYPMGESKIEKILFDSNYRSNLASTLFGPLFLDFGWFGVIVSYLFGCISWILYKGDHKIYAIYGATLLGMCDIGINYGFLITVLFACAFSLKLKLLNEKNTIETNTV